MIDVSALVGATTQEQREKLFDQLTSYLRDNAQVLPQTTIDFCNTMLLKLLQTCDVNERMAKAVEIARMPNMPQSLLLALASADIKIAAPVLVHTPDLSEELLTGIAMIGKEGHLMAIAGRSQLPATVSEAVVENGSTDVLIAVTSNPGAELSTRAIDILGKRTQDSATLEEKLCGRTDLPEAVTNQLMQTVTMRLQIEMGDKIKEYDAETIRIAIRTSQAELTHEATDRAVLSQRAMIEVTRLSQRRELTEAKLAEFIAAGRLDVATLAFARLCDLEPALARRIILTRNEETLMVAARAIPLEVETYMGLVHLARPKGALDDAALAVLGEDFLALPVATARKVMLFHRKRRLATASSRSESTQPHDMPLAAPAGG